MMSMKNLKYLTLTARQAELMHIPRIFSEGRWILCVKRHRSNVKSFNVDAQIKTRTQVYSVRVPMSKYQSSIKKCVRVHVCLLLFVSVQL